MALWGISTTTETEANNYAIPKHLNDTDRNTTPWNCFADVRGWVYRRYGTTEQSGLSTTYYDEVLVPVAGLNTAGLYGSTDLGSTGLGTATPVAVFFEDPNLNSPLSLSAGSTSGIGTGRTAYVHVVWNENVYCSAGATVRIQQYSAAGISTGVVIGYAASVGASNYNADLEVYTNTNGQQLIRNFNGQISNRVSFAFTAPTNGIGSYFAIDLRAGVVGTITDFSGGSAVFKTFSNDIVRNVGGGGTYLSGVGIGTTTLTLVA